MNKSTAILTSILCLMTGIVIGLASSPAKNGIGNNNGNHTYNNCTFPPRERNRRTRREIGRFPKRHKIFTLPRSTGDFSCLLGDIQRGTLVRPFSTAVLKRPPPTRDKAQPFRKPFLRLGRPEAVQVAVGKGRSGLFILGQSKAGLRTLIFGQALALAPLAGLQVNPFDGMLLPIGWGVLPTQTCTVFPPPRSRARASPAPRRWCWPQAHPWACRSRRADRRRCGPGPPDCRRCCTERTFDVLT